MEECVFCNRKKIRKDIVYETKHFFVKVGYGLIAPGQVMLVTKEHIPCFGELPDELEPEHERLKKLVEKVLTENFSEPFIIEYGIWGQTIRHAHRHFITLKGPGYEIKSILEEMVYPEGVSVEEVDSKGLKQIYKFEKEYVTIEEHGKLYVCHIDGARYDEENPDPSLDHRAFFTQKKGIEGVLNWKEMTEEEKRIDEEKRDITRRVLRKKLAFRYLLLN